MKNLSKYSLIIIALLFLSLVAVLYGLSHIIHEGMNRDVISAYESLPEDISIGPPLGYINEDYSLDDNFSSNLPLIIIETDGELPDYKMHNYVTGGVSYNDVEPWTTGNMSIIYNDGELNYLKDNAKWESSVKIKRRGQTTYFYEKPQYSIRLLEDDNITDREMNLFNMGEDNSWAIIGSVVDKSLIRNYVAYSIASEIDGNTLDTKFCEVAVKEGDKYIYQGLYLFAETVSRSENRINIKNYNGEDKYSGYILRRDRYTPFDKIIDNYLRTEMDYDTYIGIKYPTDEELNDGILQYITDDFNMIEETLYSDDMNLKKAYKEYIDVDSFVNYFLINEYFGNYDAGLHSTYMYKDYGDPLMIGPVWDFDQAMNNYYAEEQKTQHMAMQTRAIYEELVKDDRFLNLLMERYISLRRTTLSDDHLAETIDNAAAYIDSARQREWYRWYDSYFNEDYNVTSYKLNDIVKDGILVSRYNDDYDQEILIIKTYLRKHAADIPENIKYLKEDAEFTTDIKGYNVLVLFGVLILFAVPSIILSKKG